MIDRKDWHTWTVGSTVRADFNDGFETTSRLCRITEKHSDHLVAEVTHYIFGDRLFPEKGQPQTMWIDDTFSEYFTFIPNPKIFQ